MSEEDLISMFNESEHNWKAAGAEEIHLRQSIRRT